MEPLYTTVALATGDGRNGHVAVQDGTFETDVRVPTELGGPGGATNPEEMFAAGYAACFHAALKIVGKEMDVNLDDSTVAASVSIGVLDSGDMGLAVALDVTTPHLGRSTAQALTERAHHVCPYSHATRGNVAVALNVV